MRMGSGVGSALMYHVGRPCASYMYPATSTKPACHSMKKPRPLSAGFHHQPDSGKPACTGAVRPPGTNAWRSIAVLPPGQTMVPCVASENAKVTSPPPPSAGKRYAPVSDCPPEAERK